jgi:hypothetical protein
MLILAQDRPIKLGASQFIFGIIKAIIMLVPQCYSSRCSKPIDPLATIKMIEMRAKPR